MKKVIMYVSSAMLMTAVVAGSAMAETFDYSPFETEVTSLVGDLTDPAVAILGTALALAGGVMLVKIGFRWIRSFIR